jgi:hypothetical protein
MSLSRQPTNANPSLSELQRLRAENDKFRVECEILLQMLTEAEVKKVDLESELANRKHVLTEVLDQIDAKRIHAVAMS